MKVFIVILVALVHFKSQAQETFSFVNDKQLHYAVGATFGATFTQITLNRGQYKNFETIVVPQMVMVFIGMGKESIDFTFGTGHFCWYDIAYNQLGCLTGSLVTYGIQKVKEKNSRRKYQKKL